VLLACGGEPTTPPGPPPAAPVAQPAIPISGAAVPGMASYDQAIADFMRKYAIPGGAVAVLRDGKLIYARGFGYADVESKTPVQPDALFRIASVSKPITAPRS
jgi:N-acyl-D-amino-acid deacylase